MREKKDLVRVGCGAGFWGDTPEGPAQLVRSGGIDYLVLDYLAEITMSILARMKIKDPALGYASDFVSLVMRPLASRIQDQGIRVVTNAGGVNPEACRDALIAVFKQADVDLKVALVRGDDLSHAVESYRAAGIREMFDGRPLPQKLASVNAYLGAFPIAEALATGADIVLTGRCVDSALVLGPLIHEFGWSPADLDLLAAGSLAGHILECGTQATGGIFTDFRHVHGWADMGFPIAECRAEGTFEITKPSGTGGLVSTATVAEQIVYEVGDPACYVLPDVSCDWTQVKLEATGKDRVRVSNARGNPPPRSYKVCATYADGFRATATMMIAGRDAAAKAEAVGEAILSRAHRLLAQAGFDGFSETSVEVLGSEANYGASSRARQAREVILKIAVRHAMRDALEIFAREIYPSATAMAQGITGFAGGRPRPQPVVRVFSFLVDKADVPVAVDFEGTSLPVKIDLTPSDAPPSRTPGGRDAPALYGNTCTVPLVALAHGRSGDKADTANIGILARHPDFVPAIGAALTPEAVRSYLGHFVEGKVERFDWPGLGGFNFVLQESLGGGGTASLRYDPQGKALAQILLDFPVPVPANWLDPGGSLAGWQNEASQGGAAA